MPPAWPCRRTTGPVRRCMWSPSFGPPRSSPMKWIRRSGWRLLWSRIQPIRRTNSSRSQGDPASVSCAIRRGSPGPPWRYSSILSPADQLISRAKVVKPRSSTRYWKTRCFMAKNSCEPCVASPRPTTFAPPTMAPSARRSAVEPPGSVERSGCAARSRERTTPAGDAGGAPGTKGEDGAAEATGAATAVAASAAVSASSPRRPIDFLYPCMVITPRMRRLPEPMH